MKEKIQRFKRLNDRRLHYRQGENPFEKRISYLTNELLPCIESLHQLELGTFLNKNINYSSSEKDLADTHNLRDEQIKKLDNHQFTESEKAIITPAERKMLKTDIRRLVYFKLPQNLSNLLGEPYQDSPIWSRAILSTGHWVDTGLLKENLLFFKKNPYTQLQISADDKRELTGCLGAVSLLLDRKKSVSGNEQYQKGIDEKLKGAFSKRPNS